MPVGRPTKYRAEFAEQARKLCLLGATNEDLAKFFDVALSTIELWMQKRKAFSGAAKAGREIADATVAERLYQRAIGYEHDDVYASTYQGEVTLTPIRKYYPPDTPAATLWLKNRQPERWRDKVDHDVTGSVTVKISRDDAKVL